LARRKNSERAASVEDYFAVPRDAEPAAWRARVTGISEVLARACLTVDPQCTDETLEKLVEVT